MQKKKDDGEKIANPAVVVHAHLIYVNFSRLRGEFAFDLFQPAFVKRFDENSTVIVRGVEEPKIRYSIQETIKTSFRLKQRVVQRTKGERTR